MCEPQRGLCRVEESKPGSFLSLLIWGEILGLTCSSVVTAQDQTREQASNHAVFMTQSHAPSLSLLFIITHCPSITSLHSLLRGPYLHVSLGQFN